MVSEHQVTAEEGWIQDVTESIFHVGNDVMGEKWKFDIVWNNDTSIVQENLNNIQLIKKN